MSKKEQYKYYRDMLLSFNNIDLISLNELIHINNKSKYGINKANKEFDKGEYPFFTSGSNIYFFNQWLVDGQNIFMNDGGTADFKFFEGKSYYSDHVISFTSKNQKTILNKFLFYFLENKKEDIELNYFKGSGLKNISRKEFFSNFKVPIPPIKVQNKIVEILDKFTNYKAELTAELIARKEQYKYYRDKLLKFNNIDLISLNELVHTNNKSKYGINKANKEFDKGEYPFFTSGSNIYFFNQWLVDGQNIFMNDGGTADFKFFEGKSYYSDHVISFTSKNQKTILNKFLFYFLENKKEDIELNYFKGSGLKNISRKEFFSNFKIPIPPIEIQNKIVKILDKFSSLVNDISNGLPKEIELRNKQYEYYRDLLLNLKDK